MTLYSPFYKDFPRRCLCLLNTYYESALKDDREVTLMISIASSGFVIPFERILEKEKKKQKDDCLYSLYSNICNESFISKFTNNKESNSTWKISKTVTPKGNDINNWKGINDYSFMGKEDKVSEILPILRNALAHGKIFTEGDKNDINRIFFVAKPKIKPKTINYTAVIASPSDFRIFLDNWFDLILKLDFKFEEIVDTNNDVELI